MKSKFVFIGFVVFLFTIVICATVPELVFSESVVTTVTDKNIKRYNDEDKYMIYTVDDNGASHVFVDTDNPILLKFNSSDIYAKIEIGATYKFEVRGLRIPIFSSYQNILTMEEIKEE